MRLFDFSLYAAQRNAARAVVETASHLDQPGVIIELKQHVSTWLQLHQEVTRRVG
jgi:hypothetical protein